jgi:hypothetical protein
MKYRSDIGHFRGGSRVEFNYFAVCDRRFDWHTIEQSGKMEVRSVLRLAGDLQRSVHAPCVAPNR